MKHPIEISAAGTLVTGIALVGLGALLNVVGHIERHSADGVPPEFRSITPYQRWYASKKRNAAWGFVFMGSLLIVIAFLTRT